MTTLQPAGEAIEAAQVVVDRVALLVAENERLRVNDARYRWLRQGKRYTTVVPSPTAKNPKAKITIFVAPNPEPAYGESLDAAIDVAMGKELGQ